MFINKQKGLARLATAKGFTIIELIVVIAIIAVLAAVVLVNVTGYIAKARNVKRNSDTRNYFTALNMYYTENGHYPWDGSTGNGCCLGTPKDNGAVCGGGGPLTVCTSTNSEISKYISGLPGDTPIKSSLGSIEGYQYYSYGDPRTDGYTCSSDGSNCKNIELVWVLEGEDQKCAFGDASSGGGVTWCTYCMTASTGECP